MGRYVVLAAGTVVAISCGLNYCYSCVPTLSTSTPSPNLC